MRVLLGFIIARAARPMVLLAWYPRVLDCPGLGERSSSSLLSLKEPRELALASEVAESGLGGAGERWLTPRSYQLHPKFPWCEYTQYSTVLNYCRILPTLTNRKY